MLVLAVLLSTIVCSCGSADKSPAGYYSTNGNEGTSINGEENFIVVKDNLHWYGEITDYISLSHTGLKKRFKYQGTINDKGELIITKGDTRRVAPGVGIEGEIDGKGEVFAELIDGEILSGGWTFKKHDIKCKYLKSNNSGRKVTYGDLVMGYCKIVQEEETIFESKGNNERLFIVNGSSPALDMVMKKLFIGDDVEITHIDPWTNKKIIYHITISGVMSEDEVEQEMNEFVSNAEKSKENEPALIAKYIADNNIVVAPTSSGLYIIVNKEGNGKTVQNGSAVTVDYVGRFLDGTVFDCSREDVAKKSGTYTEQRQYEPLTYKAGNSGLVAGWEEGVMGQSAGTELTLIMPSSLAYGAKGAGSVIPPYTPLIFEITILSVE